MKLVVYAVFSLFFPIFFLVVEPAQALTITPIGASSDLVCVFLPNGKTNIARRTAKGKNKLTTFTAATGSAKRAKSAASAKLKLVNRTLTALRQALASPEVWPGFSAKELKALQPLIKSEGFVPDSFSVADNIRNLEQLGAQLAAEISAAQNIIDRIKDCKQRKMPAAGEFPLVYKAVLVYTDDPAHQLSGKGTVGVFAKIPWAYADTQQNLFCFQRAPNATGGVVAEGMTANPCYYGTISNIPGACDGLVEFDENGKYSVGIAIIRTKDFTYSTLPNRQSFDVAAGVAEAALRAQGWGDSIKFVVRPKTGADSCNGVQF